MSPDTRLPKQIENEVQASEEWVGGRAGNSWGEVGGGEGLGTGIGM